MIKGVNKQVLEINETQNGFFEKAIFFVKPEYSGMSEGRLRESAVKEIEGAGNPPKCKNIKKEKLKNFILRSILFLSGVAIGIIINTI